MKLSFCSDLSRSAHDLRWLKLELRKNRHALLSSTSHRKLQETVTRVTVTISQKVLDLQERVMDSP